MKRYLNILQTTIPKVSEDDLYLPLKQTDIDSIDLVYIRVALERHFKNEVPDSLWFKFTTLEEALQYFHSNSSNPQSTEFDENAEIELLENVEIRMPQMANSGLSENWLLKHQGDTHWQLLSIGFDKKSSEFIDENDNRLYAAFIRINYSISALHLFKENEVIEFKSGIKGFGNNSFLSTINGNCGTKKMNGTLMTIFSIRENDDNTNISKCEPKVKSNKICQLQNTPLFLNDYRLLKKGLLESIPTSYGEFIVTDNLLFTCDYEINPYYDINGVGLLYFAAYPIIADTCLLKYHPKTIQYQTIYRDIFYFANCNSTDKIIFKLNSFEENENQLKVLMSLYRESDNQKLATIVTVKVLEEQ